MAEPVFRDLAHALAQAVVARLNDGFTYYEAFTARHVYDAGEIDLVDLANLDVSVMSSTNVETPHTRNANIVEQGIDVCMRKKMTEVSVADVSVLMGVARQIRERLRRFDVTITQGSGPGSEVHRMAQMKIETVIEHSPLQMRESKKFVHLTRFHWQYGIGVAA